MTNKQYIKNLSKIFQNPSTGVNLGLYLIYIGKY